VTEEITVTVDGMTCASCVGRVERSLKALPDVGAVAVNLATGRARVEFGGRADSGAVVKALAKAGYPAREEIVQLEIEGMTCASCVGRVERALKAQPGVLEAAVNLATNGARVRFAEGATTASELATAVGKAGYGAHVRRDSEGPAAVDRHVAEEAVLRRRFLVALVLSVPVVILAMGAHMVPAFHHWLMRTVGENGSAVIQSVLTAVVLFGPGRVFLTKGLPALLRGAPEMNSLVALGSLAAFLYSLVATYLPGLLPEAARAVYFEAAASIVTLILMGRMLEARARGRAGEAIAKLARLRPDRATVVRDGAPVDVATDDLRPGDLVQLKPGERVAVDGVVSEGSGFIDESMLTGEPMPVEKGVGDAVSAGTVNGTSVLRFEVRATGADTALARILKLVEEAQETKLPVEALVDRITMWFVPVVMVLAALAAAGWFFLGPDPALPHALVAGISVLIIACPCAMGLATPMSVMVGSGRGAEMGVLFRRGDALQGLADVRLVAFDKTGTLTGGHPVLTDLWAAEGVSEAEMLAKAAAVEAGSEHPLARAVLAEAQARGLEVAQAVGGRALPGRGYRAEVGGQVVLIGNAAAMVADGVSLGSLEARAIEAADQGKTPIFVAEGGRLLGLMAVADPEKAGAATAIARLHGMGIRTAMLSGDTERTAKAIAARLGIDRVEAGLLPGDKVKALKALAAGGKVAFVGDGINDAPALAAADVGIAMGSGTDVAIATAEVVLMRGDPGRVADAIGLSRATLSNIRQNLFWAFGYNAALIPVAAGVLYPLNGMLLSPVLASAAMALSSVFVVTNALRLRRFRAGSGAD
jgi:Cu+-exporting ATPase